MNEEVQSLLDHCVEYATQLLENTGESYPFGGFIDTVGQVHPMEMEIDKKNVPNIGKVVETLSKFGDTEMAEEKMKGYAVTYEAEVAISESEKLDCIGIDIKFTGEDTPLFYLPFAKDEEGKIAVQELFAVAR